MAVNTVGIGYFRKICNRVAHNQQTTLIKFIHHYMNKERHLIIPYYIYVIKLISLFGLVCL